jgi:beta-ketoacyl synthase-like protein
MSEALKTNSVTRFRVEDWAALSPGLEAREDWMRWSGGADSRQGDSSPAAAVLPAMLRRRISTVGQMAFQASTRLSEQRTARFIFCSRHGEFDRTLRILQSLIAKEPVSPADFSLSVHNALAGLLSIAWENTAGHTVISAGADSFGYGLLEGVACLKAASSDRVMVVYFDDLLPHPYDEIDGSAETCVALALLIAPPGYDGCDFSIGLGTRDLTGQAQSASGQALDFIRFMLSDEREKKSIGERTLWHWQRCD